MKLHLLTATIISIMSFSAFAQESTQEVKNIDARLQAIEAQLTRIETLLRRSVLDGAQSKLTDGQFRVTILGEVNAAGVYAVDADTRLTTLIALAGGYTRQAEWTDIKITPKEGETIRVNEKKEPGAYKLKPGDIVTVTERFF